ncbi:uncharacterized protein LOC127254788 isoform X1 [Andrographis paniculata]|uniref:uncharacterized protein LOC127254788 isoform X1 n=1 Tax=Andrographis paniculata TaxID=175694 RepID=UPI0021E809F3|nr:uncharacterized protein LOC127254788 isoform X1 [Andrographis paniculata]
MPADFRTLVKKMNGADGNESSDSTAPITRDLLGASRALASKELDLDIQVPLGWEKRLDLKSGRVYLQRCNTNAVLPAVQDPNPIVNPNPRPRLQADLNFPPAPPSRCLFDELEASLELKLVPPFPAAVAPPPPPANFEGMCTLERVKSALDRADRKRAISMSASNSKSSSPGSTSSTAAAASASAADLMPPEENIPTTFAVACPQCLIFVLVAVDNLRCPRCNSAVSLPAAAAKKPRLDLNISI